MKATMHETTQAAASVPPVLVTSWSLCGHPLSDWVAAVTILWVCLQICLAIYDRWKK